MDIVIWDPAFFKESLGVSQKRGLEMMSQKEELKRLRVEKGSWEKK